MPASTDLWESWESNRPRPPGHVADTIHQLIVENQLSVRDAKLVLTDAIERIERFSHIMAIDHDFLDIRTLVSSRHAPQQFPAERW